jgi:hypothetical protein
MALRRRTSSSVSGTIGWGRVDSGASIDLIVALVIALAYALYSC